MHAMAMANHDHQKIKFRHVLTKIADQLSLEECRTIGYQYEISVEGLDALEVLMDCQKKGHFSENNVGGLKELLRSLNRMDLLRKYLESESLESNTDQSKSLREEYDVVGTYNVIIGGIALDIEVKRESSHWESATACTGYTSCKITVVTRKRMRPFYLEFKLYDDSRLECQFSDASAGGCGEPVPVNIGEQSQLEITKLTRQKDMDLMELSGMIDGLEALALKQRDKVREQNTEIEEQSAAIVDLQNKYSVLQSFVLFCSCYGTSAIGKKDEFSLHCGD